MKVLKQDESMFEAIADHQEMELKKHQNEERKSGDEFRLNDARVVDPRKAFDELFLEISREETRKKEEQTLKVNPKEGKSTEDDGKIMEPKNDVSFNMNNLTPEKNADENETEGIPDFPGVQKQDNKFTTEEDSNPIRKPQMNEKCDEKEGKCPMSNQEELLEISFTLETILTEQSNYQLEK